MGFNRYDPKQYHERSALVRAIKDSIKPWKRPQINVATNVSQLSSIIGNSPSAVGGTGYNTPLSGPPPYKS